WATEPRSPASAPARYSSRRACCSRTWRSETTTWWRWTSRVEPGPGAPTPPVGSGSVRTPQTWAGPHFRCLLRCLTGFASPRSPLGPTMPWPSTRTGTRGRGATTRAVSSETARPKTAGNPRWSRRRGDLAGERGSELAGQQVEAREQDRRAPLQERLEGGGRRVPLRVQPPRRGLADQARHHQLAAREGQEVAAHVALSAVGEALSRGVVEQLQPQQRALVALAGAALHLGEPRPGDQLAAAPLPALQHQLPQLRQVRGAHQQPAAGARVPRLVTLPREALELAPGGALDDAREQVH